MQHLPQLYQQLGGMIRATAKTVTLDREFTLVDVKPSAHQDDQVYARSAELRQLVPRGLCFVFGADSAPLHTLAGLHKFGYREDEYFSVGPVGDTTHLVYTEKANGECFHVSAFGDYIVMGSKNVHMLVRHQHIQEDMQLYTETRYSYARRMSMKFLELYAPQLDNIVAELSQSGATWVAECCTLDSPHIVEYVRDTMPFFAITRPPLYAHGGAIAVRTELTAMGPKEAEKLFIRLGVERVTMNVSSSNSDQALQNLHWAHLENSEGAVVYEVTEQGAVRHIYKLKSHEYVLWRAVREKMRVRCTSAAIQRRLRDLHVRPRAFPELELEACEFNAWARGMYRLNFDEVFMNWPACRTAFRQVAQDTRTAMLEKFDQATRERSTTQVQLIAVGLPGCGKTTVLRHVMAEFLGEYLDQDMCDGKPAYYHSDARRISQSEVVQLVAFGKNNHTDRIRTEFLNNIKQGQQVWVSWYHPEDAGTSVAHLAALSVQRATERAERAEHPLRANKVKMVVGSFRNRYEALADDIDSIPVDATLPVADQVRTVREALQLRFPHLKRAPSASATVLRSTATP